MTPEQREELKAAASAATSGKWESDETRVYLPHVAGGFDLRRSPNAEANAKHIALSNPSAILSLIAQVEALTVPQWISVENALPKCSKKPNSFGVEVIVYPQPEKGESTAFFGCRITDKPGFYKYGHVVKGVTHWMYVPTIPAIPGTKEEA